MTTVLLMGVILPFRFLALSGWYAVVLPQLAWDQAMGEPRPSV